MLMFVFGAGASYDSDPTLRPSAGFDIRQDSRPPLARSLFDPLSYEGKDAIAAFKRAAPLIMRLREAAARGLDVEEVLEQIQDEGTAFPHTATQLLALRAYLTQLLTDIPKKWSEGCQGLTNYVLALDEASHWQATTDPSSPFACVTFNYDTLLEDAIERVFGWQTHHINDYVTHADVQLFKPHGSVNWRQQARWDQSTFFTGEHALLEAIDRASELQWITDAFTIRQNPEESYQGYRDPTMISPPALTIPAQNKSAFMMPARHHDALVTALATVDTVIAVGWRAREQHFLRLLANNLPSAPGRLVVVSETNAAAEEALENLWATGRFGQYLIGAEGFSAFVETPAAGDRPTDDGWHLRDVFASGAFTWTIRKPGPGLPPEPAPVPLAPAHYST